MFQVLGISLSNRKHELWSRFHRNFAVYCLFAIYSIQASVWSSLTENHSLYRRFNTCVMRPVTKEMRISCRLISFFLQAFHVVTSAIGYVLLNNPSVSRPDKPPTRSDATSRSNRWYWKIDLGHNRCSYEPPRRRFAICVISCFTWTKQTVSFG